MYQLVRKAFNTFKQLANGWGSGLSTCKESGPFLKSMSSQNFSSFGHHCRRLALQNSHYICDVTQLDIIQQGQAWVRRRLHLALFSSDQVSLSKLSKNWGSERMDTHYYTIDRDYNCHKQAHTCTHREMDEGLDCLPARKLDSFSNSCNLRTWAVLDITAGDLPFWTLTTPLMSLSLSHSSLVITSACCSSARTGGERRGGTGRTNTITTT